MATYVVETYLSRAAEGQPDATIGRVVSSADAISAEGPPVRYLRSIFIPDDDTVLLLFEADSIEVVRAVTVRAGIDVDRIALTDSREP
ncbi:MAG: DUF4242 domain-containing protein [Chloroflexi bacterium]|nr:DUF4242 domain-containing protein [Chloroflexota bacterium]